MTVFMVPLTFLNQGYVASEATIAYAEIPKVALLRILASLIALLWALEWVLKSKAFDDSPASDIKRSFVKNLKSSNLMAASISWLKVHPTRWLAVAAGLFFGSTFLSTILSGSVSTSVWGEVPGQDGYSAYTIASYGILFGIISTHLKSRTQLGRLLGTIIFMGTLVGLYGTLQALGHDFLNLTETTGGGVNRVTIFMGNTIFAATVLSMTVPITLIAAALSLETEHSRRWIVLKRVGYLGESYIFTSSWALLLAVQFLGLMFTFSRGPWIGTAVALISFISLLTLLFGWRSLTRVGLILMLAGVFSVSFLHLQGSVSIAPIGPWFGIALGLLGLLGTFAALLVSQRYGRLILWIGVSGIIAIVLGTFIIGSSALSGPDDFDSITPRSEANSTTTQISDRISSFKPNSLEEVLGGRLTHWSVSWKLIKDRPWFEFDDLSLSWLRPLIGYGPDLFRYTYLLESTAEDLSRSLTPFEPDHAHNFFIHQTVELGLIGGFAALAIFTSVFAIVGHHVLKRFRTGNPIYSMFLIGLMAVIFGRFVEMMVGVARISDLTVLWVIFGLFASLIAFDDAYKEKSQPVETHPQVITNPKRRRRAVMDSAEPVISVGMLVRIALCAILIGVIGVVTWQRGVNPVRASIAVAQANDHFRNGDLDTSIEKINRAIQLAPDVPTYYTDLANVYLTYRLQPDLYTDPGCEQQNDKPYLVCLGIENLQANLNATNAQKLSFRSWVDAGYSAFNLQLHESALKSFANASNMVPNSWPSKNDYGEALINVGKYDDAIDVLDEGLEITGGSNLSARALNLKGRALTELGRFNEAVTVFKDGLTRSYNDLYPDLPIAKSSLHLIQKINTELGLTLNFDHFNALIDSNPDDAVAYYNRGIAHLVVDNVEEAIIDLDKSMSIGLVLGESKSYLGYAKLKSGQISESKARHLAVKTILTQSLQQDPTNPLVNTIFGEYLVAKQEYARALNYLEAANTIDETFDLAYLVRSKLFLSMGLEESARELLNTTVGLNLLHYADYIDRGKILAFFGENDKAFADLNRAIELNPNQAKSYNVRAMIYANIGDFHSALKDLTIAIKKDRREPQYFINRGVIYDILRETNLSKSDFEMAISLNATKIPIPEDRNETFFAFFPEPRSLESQKLQLLKLIDVRQSLHEIDLLEKLAGSDHEPALQFRGQAFFHLGLWPSAVDQLSRLIKLYPNTPEAYRFRGESYLGMGMVEAANSDFETAVNLNTNDSDNFVARGKGLASIGEYESALRDFNKALLLNPNSSNAYKLRGYLSVQAGDYYLAFSDLDRAIEIDPLNDDAFIKRYEANYALGQISIAGKDLEQAINLAPTNAEYRYFRGLLHLNSGDFQEAIEDFQEAIGLRQYYRSIDSRHADPLIGIAKAYLEMGNPMRAVEYINAAIYVLNQSRAHEELAGLGTEGLWGEISLKLTDTKEFLYQVQQKLASHIDTTTK